MVATAFLGLAVAYKQTPRATAIISQAVTPLHGALDIISSIPGAAPLRGLPRAMCYRPVNTGLIKFRSPSVRHTPLQIALCRIFKDAQLNRILSQLCRSWRWATGIPPCSARGIWYRPVEKTRNCSGRAPNKGRG